MSFLTPYIPRSIDWSIDWLIDRSIDWLIDYLFQRLVCIWRRVRARRFSFINNSYHVLSFFFHFTAQRDSRDEDRRGNGFSISSSTGSLSSVEGGSASTPQFSYLPQSHQPQHPNQQHSSPVPPRNPNNSPANVAISATLPTPTEFQQHYNLNIQTRLENPTRFYVEEKQKQQMKSYFSNSLGRASPLLGNSLPAQLSLSNVRQHSLNSQVSPDSPMTPHSIGTPHSPAITDVSEVIMKRTTFSRSNPNFILSNGQHSVFEHKRLLLFTLKNNGTHHFFA